jgi:hypothetical protein
VSTSNEIWPVERPDGMPNIVSLEVMCGKDHMDVHLSFSHPFEGIVSSKGKDIQIIKFYGIELIPLNWDQKSIKSVPPKFQK